MTTICGAIGCYRKADGSLGGLCSNHNPTKRKPRPEQPVCSAAGCRRKPYIGSGSDLCPKHNREWLLSTSLARMPKPKPNRPVCSAAGCHTKPKKGSDLCWTHKPKPEYYKPRPERPLCSATECKTRVYKGADLCARHRPRLETQNPGPPKYRTIMKFCSYNASHKRCRRQWGSASLHLCVDCGKQARDWAYDGTDPTQLRGPGKDKSLNTWHYYSQYPEFYMPLCGDCHRVRDEPWRERTFVRLSRQEYEEFCQWKRATEEKLWLHHMELEPAI